MLRKNTPRNTYVPHLCAALSLFIGTSSRANDLLDRPINLDIAKHTRLEEALIEWGRAVGVTVLAASPSVERDVEQEVKGAFTAGQALSEILRETGLTFEKKGNEIIIVPCGRSGYLKTRFMEAGGSLASVSGLATANSEPFSNDADESTDDGKEERKLEEVIVTSQKREERIQDVPMSISSINTQELLENDELRLQDYATTVPGFTATPTPSAGSQNTLTIRGLTTGFNTNSTVAIVIDDVPFDGYTTPDLDPSDLSRIEVLRGPQGTLYGGGGMGGLVKYVTVDPDPSAVSGRVEAGLSDVHNGDQAGYNVRGAVNIPITDSFAIRASGFTRQDPGYIDNLTTHEDGVNEGRVVGARIAALWRPTSDFSIRLSALYQDTQGFGFDGIEIGPGLGNLQQAYLPETGGYNRQIQTYSATVKWTLGPITITSLTGYNVNRQNDSFDDSFSLGGVASQLLGDPNVTGAAVRDHFHTYKFSEEFHFSGSVAALDWLVGVYYTRDLTDGIQDVYGAYPDSGVLSGQILHLNGPSTNEEGASFADLTYHFTDRFDLQIGGRESNIWQTTYPKTEEGSLVGGDNLTPRYSDGTQHAFTYLFTPSFKITQDLNVYGRVATGFNPGGSDYSGPTAECVMDHYPCSTQPDKTTDYEIGTKGDALNHLVNFDLAFYYIKWTDLVANFMDPVTTFNYSANVGAAKSEGVELSTDVHPLEGLTVSGWITWNEAVLTEVPPGNGSEIPGARLPYGARWSGNLAVNQRFPISGQITGFVGAATTYIGQRYGTFAGPPRTVFSPYVQTDLRSGLSYGPWAANLYVNNVADKRAIIGGGLGTFPDNAYTIILPRTIGVNVSRSF